MFLITADICKYSIMMNWLPSFLNNKSLLEICFCVRQKQISSNLFHSEASERVFSVPALRSALAKYGPPYLRGKSPFRSTDYGEEPVFIFGNFPFVLNLKFYPARQQQRPPRFSPSYPPGREWHRKTVGAPQAISGCARSYPRVPIRGDG